MRFSSQHGQPDDADRPAPDSGSSGGAAQDGSTSADHPASGSGLGGPDDVALPDLWRLDDPSSPAGMSLPDAGQPGGAADARKLAPLSADRLPVALDRIGYHWFSYPDKSVGGLWDGAVFYFLVHGQEHEVLQVVGKYARSASIDRLEELLAFINEWHVTKVWPKVFARVQDNGVVNIYTELNTDLEYGVRDDQLDLLLRCGIDTSLMFFSELDSRYPDPLMQSPA